MKPKLHELTDRWAALLLVLVIVFWLFAGPLSQKADAVVVSSVIVGAVIATMALAGITFVASGMTAAQLQDWVSDKLNEWAADLGSPLDHLINSAGIGVTISGLLTVGTAAAQGISDFITWFKNDQSITDNSSVQVIEESTKVNGYDVCLIPYRGVSINGNGYISISTSNSEDSFWYMNSDTLFIISSISNNLFYVRQFIGDYNFRTTNVYTSQPVSPKYYGYASPIDANTNSIPSKYIHDNVSPSALIGLNPDIVTSGSMKINTGIITIPQVQNDDKVFLDVGALPGSTVTEVTEGVISDAVTNTLDVSGEVAESEPEYVIDGPEPVYGLADVFPFCIPFDLYDFVSCLAADPVAPHFEWRLYVEDLVDYTFVIDLQQFETVAQIFRTMFLLAFIIGLAMVTRHLLRS